jgi:hypothetical protein
MLRTCILSDSFYVLNLVWSDEDLNKEPKPVAGDDCCKLYIYNYEIELNGLLK